MTSPCDSSACTSAVRQTAAIGEGRERERKRGAQAGDGVSFAGWHTYTGPPLIGHAVSTSRLSHTVDTPRISRTFAWDMKLALVIRDVVVWCKVSFRQRNFQKHTSLNNCSYTSNLHTCLSESVVTIYCFFFQLFSRSVELWIDLFRLCYSVFSCG